MSIDHDAPYAALADRLQTYCRDYLQRPVSRKLISWDQLGQAEQAAICVVGSRHIPKLDGPVPVAWTIEALVVIYARADADPGSSAAFLLNKLIGRVEAALQRQPDETAISPGQQLQAWTTLGGTVLRAHPGPVEIDEGNQTNEGIAVMTVEMLPYPA